MAAPRLNPKADDFPVRKIYREMAERYGFTPDVVSRMTLPQLAVYLEWVKSPGERNVQRMSIQEYRRMFGQQL